MIQLSSIRYSIGQRILFEDVDWVVGPGDRVALVGPNGAGKTTLLKVILGELTPEAGTRVLSRGTRLGYLPQEAAERFEGTVLDRAMEAHHEIRSKRAELDTLLAELSDVNPEDPRLDEMLERLGTLQHELEHHGEHALEPKARQVLAGLGFSDADQNRPLAEFSGGWRMRAALAALLLSEPTVLFMDEPTNHLDLPAMEWLEDHLEDFPGGLVVVSHDRVFLDRVATEVRELDHGTMTPYSVRFSLYLEEKEIRREQMQAQNAQLGSRIAELQRFVERFGAKNTKAAQAQSKRKMIDRLKEQRIVIPHRPKSVRFSFPDPPHSGRSMVRLRDVSFGYDAGPDILSVVNAEIAKGDKIAIVGANGAGKTTLLRVLAGQLAQRSGEREQPPQTKAAYFAQHAAETLDPSLTVLGALEEIASDSWRPKLRSLLGNFLFAGDDVFKLCRILSGGERQRVAIARMLLQPSNLLLLDEPTHHLDIAGKEVLEEGLTQYPGAVVVVTHDRSLMARVATRVLAVDAGRVIVYPGGYDDYEEARITKVAASIPDDEPPARASTASSGPKAKSAPPPAPDARQQRERSRDDRRSRDKRSRESERIEKEIETREKRIAELEIALADPDVYQDGERSRSLVSEYERIRSELEALWQGLESLG